MAAKRARVAGDEQAANELYLAMKSDGSIYKRRQAIEEMLYKKFAGKGLYLSSRAQDAFKPLVDLGAKNYAREYATPGEWNTLFNATTRRWVANQFVQDFEAEARIRKGSANQSGDRTYGPEGLSPVAAYIAAHRRIVKEQAQTHAAAAQIMRSRHPALVAEVEDIIGSHPSSDIELRALQGFNTRNRSGGRRPSNTKSAAKARLLKAWRNQYKGKARGSEVADAMQGALDAGMTQNEIDSVMDRASGGKSFNVGRVGEPGYRNRSGTAKPRPYGTDRDRFHGNPNARKSRNKSGGESPEEALFERWMKARRIRDRLRNKQNTPADRAKFQRNYALADKLQYELQDMSPLGYRMVWGTEFASRRK